MVFSDENLHQLHVYEIQRLGARHVGVQVNVVNMIAGLTDPKY